MAARLCHQGPARAHTARVGTNRRIRRALLDVQFFVGAIAAVCGPLLIITDGLGMDRATLAESPFDTFVVPRLVLGIVVGGSLLAGAWLVWRQHPEARAGSLLAGLILLGWILVEIVWITDGRPLQATILALAVVVLLLAWRYQPRRRSPA